MFLSLYYSLCQGQRKTSKQSINYINSIRKGKTQDSPAKAKEHVPVFRQTRKWPTITKKVNKPLNLWIGHHQVLLSGIFVHTFTRVQRPEAHYLYDLLEVAFELLGLAFPDSKPATLLTVLSTGVFFLLVCLGKQPNTLHQSESPLPDAEDS